MSEALSHRWQGHGFVRRRHLRHGTFHGTIFLQAYESVRVGLRGGLQPDTTETRHALCTAVDLQNASRCRGSAQPRAGGRRVKQSRTLCKAPQPRGKQSGVINRVGRVAISRAHTDHFHVATLRSLARRELDGTELLNVALYALKLGVATDKCYDRTVRRARNSPNTHNN